MLKSGGEYGVCVLPPALYCTREYKARTGGAVRTDEFTAMEVGKALLA